MYLSVLLQQPGWLDCNYIRISCMHAYMSSYNAYISEFFFFFIRIGLKCYLSASDKTEEQYDFERTWWFITERYPVHDFILSGLSANVCSTRLTDRSVNCRRMYCKLYYAINRVRSYIFGLKRYN